jgi:prepilin-type N-terminal cleavage/methylation domain-containing protein
MRHLADKKTRVIPVVPERGTARRLKPRRAFTLVEVLVVTGVIGVLAAISLGVLGRGRDTARRADCDIQLKGVAMGLDAYRQENGRYPLRLEELVERKYLPSATALRCPADERGNGSYAEGYIVRAPREAAKMGEVPLLVCPHHEKTSHGAQVYNARYTRQFTVAPAKLASANATSVERPDGKGPISGAAGMALHGGDRLRSEGGAVIEFADGSRASLRPGADVTVLQSFWEGSGRAPLYTLVRQTIGEVSYRVREGSKSKFDVSTPTATAGSRGTEFIVTVAPNGDSTVRLLTQSDLFVSTRRGTARAIPNQSVSIVGGIVSGGVGLVGGLLNGLL